MERDKEKEVVLCAPAPLVSRLWCAKVSNSQTGAAKITVASLPRGWLLFLHSHPAREVEVGSAILRCCSSHASKGGF